jgi:dissimilatory sulfite reductase (desulfoviridin) alpha/beta subunit
VAGGGSRCSYGSYCTEGSTPNHLDNKPDKQVKVLVGGEAGAEILDMYCEDSRRRKKW